MGLLSDPEYGSVKWVKVLKKVHGPLCFLCYIGALVWFVMLGNREFNNETYFSENALLPGLVTNEFNAEQSAKQFYNELNQELEDKYYDIDDMPVPWLVAKMSQLHLEVYTHNFTLNYPMGQGQVYKGTNVYGILRAPRTSSLEALVVSAPFRSISSHQKGTTAGIALMLAFAQFARPQKYWAKDLIFLITEHEQLGMQAWLEAYHGLHNEAGTYHASLGGFWRPGTRRWNFGKLARNLKFSYYKKCLDSGKLKGRSGSIQAAINLEFHTPKIKYIEVKVEGLNGQLPNLDLVNLVHKLCVKSGIHHSYKNSYSWIRNRNKMDDWMNNVWTMLGMVSTQIAGVPNGNHGLFHRFGIEAVTLEGRDANDPAGTPPKVNALSSANFFRLAVPLESVLRSLNNLLERFHQSYFFYLLAATNRFISIGQYMPCLCLLCVAMLVRALSLWVTIQQDGDDDVNTQTNEQKRKNSDTELPGQKESEEPKASEEKCKVYSSVVPDYSDNKFSFKVVYHKLRQRNKKSTVEEKTKETPPKKMKTEENDDLPAMRILNVMINYSLVHLIGYSVALSPMLLSHIGAKYFNQPSEISVYYGFIVLSLLITVFTPFMIRIVNCFTRDEIVLTNILLLVELATACLVVGMQNFSLGLVIAVAYTPLALVVGVVEEGGGKKSSIALFLKRVLCLLFQPLCIVSVCMIAYSRVLFPEENIFEMISRGKDAAMQATMFSIVDFLIYDNWLFGVATTIILPTWILFWQILCNRVNVQN